MPTSIRLSQESEARLTRLAEQTGRSKAFYLRQMIDQGLDDAEDHYLGLQVLQRIERGEEKTFGWPEVKKQLGLGD